LSFGQRLALDHGMASPDAISATRTRRHRQLPFGGVPYGSMSHKLVVFRLDGAQCWNYFRLATMVGQRALIRRGAGNSPYAVDIVTKCSTLGCDCLSSRSQQYRCRSVKTAAGCFGNMHRHTSPSFTIRIVLLIKDGDKLRWHPINSLCRSLVMGCGCAIDWSRCDRLARPQGQDIV